MKLTAYALSALAAAGLLIGTLSAPALAGKKAAKPKDPNIFELIEADLKALDKAIFGTPKKTKKKSS
jgi:hypothetical protein